MKSFDTLMHCFFLLGVLCVFGVESFAQTGRLIGTITDDVGRPIGAAHVTVIGTPYQTSTDSDGRYRLDNVAVGAYSIRVSAVGFEAASRSTMVAAGVELDASFTLVSAVLVLDEIQVSGTVAPGTVRSAEAISDMVVMAGAKSEVLQVAGTAASLAEKNARQLFSHLPGVFVNDMDGAGNQINIATRGLDPHRSWEINVRQDGVLVNSDIYGYPASHYSLPLEAVERIEYVRGTAALQYGSQFGGLLNYITRSPDNSARVQPQLRGSMGSNDLMAGFGWLGGKVGHLSFSAYLSARQSAGYRRNARSIYDAQFLSLSLPVHRRVTLRGQVGRSFYRYQIPGPLTDAMFGENPRAATRSRNWFSPDITVPSFRLDWELSGATRLMLQSSAVLGVRNSVQFIGFATTPDLPDSAGVFAPRLVDIDRFRSFTNEVRLTHDYRVGRVHSTLAAGVAYTNNRLHRRQQGRGTTGADYDLTLISGDFARDVTYHTQNVAIHAENLMRITPRWMLVPGVRLENGETQFTGRLAYYDPSGVPNKVRHRFPLFGLRTEYSLTEDDELYGGLSQAYRPMILKDVLPENALERTDSALKDARGWTLEGGVRGRIASRVRFDVTAFALRYNDRFGGILQTDAGGTSYLFKTNVGSSLNRGVELSLDIPFRVSSGLTLSAFTATSYYDATYRKGSVVSGGQNQSIVGNRVESVPRWISRSGVQATHHRMTGSVTISYVGDSFADPLNTVTPSANGAVGIVPAHTVMDLGLGLNLTSWIALRGGVSNLFDLSYFTKRPTFYPGPGIWPSDGRSVHLNVEFDW